MSWTKEVPKQEGYYWVRAKGDLTGREYIHPVHLYKSNKDQTVPDRVFSDGENFSISHSLFIEWWTIRIEEPLPGLKAYHYKLEPKMDKKKVRKYYLATIECLLATGQVELGVGLLMAMVSGDVETSKKLLIESKKYMTHENVLEKMDSEFRFWEVEELPKGVRVKTLEPKNDRNYTESARKSRKWGVKGEIIDVHNSHGLCYDVKHEDGSIGSYDPDEFELIIDE